MQEPATWQELLSQLIADPKERVRLARALHVRPITLLRWIEGSTRPRVDNMSVLLKNISQENKQLFMQLLAVDYPELLRSDASLDLILRGIPAEFYARAMSNRSLTSISIYHQSMQDLLLQQALGHLDPDQQGLAITLAVCVPPRSGRKVRSMRVIGGLGTPPWPHNLRERLMFLGAESLVGYAVTHAHFFVVNSRDEKHLFAVQWAEHEESIAVFPILLYGRMVGCLTISSTRQGFFKKLHLEVLQNYAHLFTCIFEPEASFAFHEIELGVMPAYVSQSPYFADYHKRVSQKLLDANTAGEQLTVQMARQLVWQDLEEVLL